jgi:hypothetical protein
LIWLGPQPNEAAANMTADVDNSATRLMRLTLIIIFESPLA